MSYVLTHPASAINSVAAAAATVAGAQERGESSAAASVGGMGVDARLVVRAQNGDMHAFGQLVERYQRPMTVLVARMTQNPDDVDDIVQELFVRAWKGLPRFRGDAQFSTWLYRIAVNTAIKHRARRKTENAVSLSAEDITGGVDGLSAVSELRSCGDDPAAVAQRREQEKRIREAVSALPEKQRAVVVLHYFEGHSCDEISRIVGCSVGTVWSRLHYACKRLRGILEPAEGVA
jgi:RNA polymerase sigma-70 factor (ECF subfamily)